MSRLPSHAALLDLPSLPGRSVLRAGLMALDVLPGAMPAERDRGRAVLRALQSQPDSVLFIDISNMQQAVVPTLLQLDAVLPRNTLREPIVLTRRSGGHVNRADRQWVRALGFADLLPEFDAQDCEGSLRSALDATASLLVHVTHEQAFQDENFFCRFAVSDAADALAPADLVRELSGTRGVAVADRSYLGTTYSTRWIGSDAVDQLCGRYELARHEAWLALHRLMQFGLIEPVTQECLFIDGNFFYRFVGLSLDPEKI